MIDYTIFTNSMAFAQSPDTQFTALFSDVTRYAPVRDRYGMIVDWDFDKIREPYRKSFKSEDHYMRWKKWCDANTDIGNLLYGKDYRAWLVEMDLPTTVPKDELRNVLRFGYDWCKKNIAPKNIRIGYGETISAPEPDLEDNNEPRQDYM